MEGLIDIGVLMFVLIVDIVRELRIMHLVIGFKSYKTALGVVMQALGRIECLLVQIGKISYSTVFMVVNTNNYDWDLIS